MIVLYKLQLINVNIVTCFEINMRINLHRLKKNYFYTSVSSIVMSVSVPWNGTLDLYITKATVEFLLDPTYFNRSLISIEI